MDVLGRIAERKGGSGTSGHVPLKKPDDAEKQMTFLEAASQFPSPVIISLGGVSPPALLKRKSHHDLTIVSISERPLYNSGDTVRLRICILHAICHAHAFRFPGEPRLTRLGSPEKIGQSGKWTSDFLSPLIRKLSEQMASTHNHDVCFSF